ncbi:MAG TPA: hypothetical protein PLY45_02835 [bacterium]|nr:hypothetical protein [bacterium]
MKKFIAIVVALGVAGFVWAGCQKKAVETTPEAPKAEVAQPMTPPPPPPPPPPPAPAPEGEQKAE